MKTTPTIDAGFEAEKVRLVLQGDPQAAKWLYEKYQRRLYAVCVYLLGWRDPEAEDVVQETFMIALDKLAGFRFESSLYTWLNGICVNKCRERIRARIREDAASREDLDRLAHPAHAHADGEATGRTDRRLELLPLMMERLPDRCRALIQGKDYEKRSYAELAKAHKMVISTVGVTLKRCRERLKELILGAEKGGSHG